MKEINKYSSFEQSEAIQNAILNGSSIISEAIAPRTICLLKELVNFETEEIIDGNFIRSELTELHQTFNATEKLLGEYCINLFGSIIPAFTEKMSEKSHQDVLSSTKGISLLIPVQGESALFCASSEPFEMNSDIFGDASLSQQEYCGEYGMGDVVIVRQSIDYLNGEIVDLDQIHHAGASNNFRKIVYFDIFL